MRSASPNDPMDRDSMAMGPMTVGNIVSSGFKLYTSNFGRYILIALKSALWVFVPVLLALVFTVVFALVLGENPTAVLPLLGILIPAWIVLMVFCWAQSLGESAGIARLAYQELSGTPEDDRTALRFTRSRKWSLLGANILRGLIFFAAYIVFVIVTMILLVILGITTGVGSEIFEGASSGAELNPAIGILIGLFFVVGLIAFLLFYAWLATRYLLIDPSLAVEPSSGAAEALGRSWKLTGGHVIHSILVAAVAFLVGIPVYIVINIISQIISTLLLTAGQLIDPNLLTGISVLLSYLVGIIGGIATTPFWQSILATLYFDLRNRKEGLDLTLSR